MKNNLKMKIAIILRKKLSLDSGSESRNYYLVNGLARKFSVKTYVPAFGHTAPTNHGGKLSLLYRIILILSGRIPYIEGLKKAQFTEKELKELENTPIIQLQEMSAYYMFEKFLDRMKGKIILDTHNIDYLRFLGETESKNIFEKYVGKLLAIKLKRMELRAIKKFDHILVCSQKEKDYYSKYINSKKITVIPNGADYKRFSLSNRVTSNTILFMGLLSYQPNSEGLKYYIDHVHPRILSEVPDAQLVILGKDAPEWLKTTAESDPSIKLVGFVTDVREHIREAKVCIRPILSGSGTRLKILEYMAMGKPVVSTTIGAEGIKVKDKDSILLADGPALFSKNVVSALVDKQMSEELGRNARNLIEKKYDWSAITVGLQRLYDKLYAAKLKPDKNKYIKNRAYYIKEDLSSLLLYFDFFSQGLSMVARYTDSLAIRKSVDITLRILIIISYYTKL